MPKPTHKCFEGFGTLLSNEKGGRKGPQEIWNCHLAFFKSSRDKAVGSSGALLHIFRITERKIHTASPAVCSSVVLHFEAMERASSLLALLEYRTETFFLLE